MTHDQDYNAYCSALYKFNVLAYYYQEPESSGLTSFNITVNEDDTNNYCTPKSQKQKRRGLHVYLTYKLNKTENLRQRYIHPNALLIQPVIQSDKGYIIIQPAIIKLFNFLSLPHINKQLY